MLFPENPDEYYLYSIRRFLGACFEVTLQREECEKPWCLTDNALPCDTPQLAAGRLHSIAHFLMVYGCGKPMPTRSKVLGDRAVCGEKPLRVSGGLEPLHTPLPLTGRLMRVLRPVIEIPMLAMFHAREDLALGGPIALEFIRDDDPRSVLTAFEELAEEPLGGPFVPSPLH